MAQPSDATYLRQRARSSREAALDATDICARSAHARMAKAYEVRSQEAEAASDTEAGLIIDMIGGGPILATASRP